MANNSLNTLLQQLMKEDTVQQMSGMLGTDMQTTQQAIGAALPTLLAGLGKEVQTPEGAQALASALDRDHDGSILDDIGGYVSNGPDVNQGNKILGHLFGGQQETVQNSLGNATGIGGQGMGALLAGLAPLVLGALGKEKKENGLDVGGLVQMLLTGNSNMNQQTGGGMDLLNNLFDQGGDGSGMDDLLNMGGSLLGGLFGGKK